MSSGGRSVRVETDRSRKKEANAATRQKLSKDQRKVIYQNAKAVLEKLPQLTYGHKQGLEIKTKN